MGGLFLDVLGGALEEKGVGLENTAGGVLAFHYGLRAVLEHVGANALVHDGETPTFVGDLEAENQLLRIPVIVPPTTRPDTLTIRSDGP